MTSGEELLDRCLKNLEEGPRQDLVISEQKTNRGEVIDAAGRVLAAVRGTLVQWLTIFYPNPDRWPEEVAKLAIRDH